MQDIHSIESGGGGRLFGGGDRRLRPHHGQSLSVLKCPRCESINTKFCYYNNYNLSQPRHFCKSCRRYWTKGGVLRNVPVGGGCRKTKRSKPKGNTSDSDVPTKERKSSNSQNSSSESSSLTASTTAATAQTQTTAANGTAATEILSGSSSNSASTFLNFHEPRIFSIRQSSTANPNFDPPLMDQTSETSMFPEIGTFTSLMTTSNDPIPLGFNIADISPYQLQQQSHGQVVENQSSDQHWEQQQQQKMIGNMHELGGGYLDQTVQMEFSELQNRTSNGGLAAVDWQSGEDQGMFDLAGTVDQSYWNQTQWADDDHQLNYLP